MSMSLCDLGRMMPMKSMHGTGYMHGMQKPDASEFANQLIQKRDNESDGALSADELGKLSERLGLVEAYFDENGLIDRQKLRKFGKDEYKTSRGNR